MAQQNSFVQTYKTIGAQPVKFYTLWVLFFTAASALYGYGYYLLLPVAHFFCPERTRLHVLLSPGVSFRTLSELRFR